MRLELSRTTFVWCFQIIPKNLKLVSVRVQERKMEQKWVLWLILVVHGVAILLFTRGFLLTRTELPFHSHCSDASQSPCFSNSNSSRCWTKPAVDRLVIIVLDALRWSLTLFLLLLLLLLWILSNCYYCFGF